jgi:hypothetical protein
MVEFPQKVFKVFSPPNLYVVAYHLICPCGAMEARETSNLEVAGSTPAMDFHQYQYPLSNSKVFQFPTLGSPMTSNEISLSGKCAQ